MEQKKYDLRACKLCRQLIPRMANGKFPNGKDTRYVDLFNDQWNGNTCPKCVRNKNKSHYHLKKQNDGQEGTGR